MPENEIRKSDDDEISLIDLLVVLLEYRRLILTVVIFGIIAAVGFYAVRVGKTKPGIPELEEKYSGRMMVIINPRLGGGIQTWFDFKDMITDSIRDSGLPEEAVSALTINYWGNGADIHFKSGVGEKEQIEKLFSLLLEKAETMAAAYYGRYAEDLISYVDSGEFEITGTDYNRYRWAKDFLSGDETVLQTLYPPLITKEVEILERGSLRMSSVIIVLAFTFLAVFLAFAVNAFKNFSADNEALAKIRGALGKNNRENKPVP
ncbi:MAG: hypothetical protein LBG08_00430 [Spirochaetaceae bacterium]|jgi:hypothetical protein|nr:hypothetical protein [Spirochaetaceae bacterium]